MVCYGCGKKFRQNTTEVVEEPHNIVLARKEFRQYVNEAGLLKMSFKKEFVHYHVKKKCVLYKDLSFDPQSIIVSQDIRSLLQESHKALIKHELEISV